MILDGFKLILFSLFLISCGPTTNDSLVSSKSSNSATSISIDSISLGKYNNSGLTHSCVVSEMSVICSGGNTSGQLGDGSRTDSFDFVAVTGLAKNVLQVSVNHQSSCALKTDNTVWCWGYNTFGGLGNGTTTQSSVPVQVIRNSDDTPLEDIKSISVGYLTTCALDNSNEVWCWGYAAAGALGDGTTVQKNKAVKVLRFDGSSNIVLDNIESLDGGGYHFCAVRNDSTGWCWGRGSYGQLGNTTSVNSEVATQVQKFDGSSNVLFNNIETMAVGTNHSCAIDSNSKTWCWGLGTFGRLGNGADTLRESAYEVLKEDNTSLLATQIDIGHEHSCAIGTDTIAYCWGRGDTGQLGNNIYEEKRQKATPVLNPDDTSQGLSSFSKIVAGNKSTCGIVNEKAYCWGSNARGELSNLSKLNVDTLIPKKSTQLSNVKSLVTISSFNEVAHHCALMNDTEKTMKCWGINSLGQLGNGTIDSTTIPTTVLNETGIGNLENITSASSSNYHTCAIASGQVYCWGRGTSHQLGHGLYVSAQTLPVKVIKTDDSEFNDAIRIEVGPFHSCAIDASSQIWCWGNNVLGSIGDGTTTLATKATKVLNDNLGGGTEDFNNAIDISLGDRHTCAVDSANQAWCWGFNIYGAVGNNTTTNQTYAVKVLKDNGGVSDFNNAQSISAGQYSTCIIDTSTNLWCWGAGTYGKTAQGNSSTTLMAKPALKSLDNTQLNNITKIHIGVYSACALDSINGLWCWGANYTGVIPVKESYDSTSTRAENILDPLDSNQVWDDVNDFAFSSHAGCALTIGGDIYCWGSNENAQFANNNKSSSAIPIKLN